MLVDEFGETLKAYLKEHHITQTELARRMYVTQECVNNYTNRQSGVTIATLRRIRAALGCTWEDLLGE